MKIVDLDQQSPDWLNWRMGGIGGSDAPIIMGVSKFTTRDKLLAQKAARRFGFLRQSDKGKSPAMMRGIKLEPEIRDEYNRRTGRDLRPACGLHDTIAWLRASFDGLRLPDCDLVLEIKCPNQDDHHSALGGLVPSHYWPQMQHLLAVSGSKKLHYLSYSENRRFGDRHHAIVKVAPDPQYIEELIAAERLFVEEMQRIRAKMKKSK